MKRVGILNEFPFTFSEEATIQIFKKQESRCSFLSKRGIHGVGMWMCECSCGLSLVSFDSPRLKDVDWDLSSKLCPCRGSLSPLSGNLSSWADYYEWRCIPLDSPAALILHWPLTVYHATRITYLKTWGNKTWSKLSIHYLGPDKELLQLDAFRELLALFPGVQVHIDLIGPEIPQHRDGKKFEFCSFAHCLDDDCPCRSSSYSISCNDIHSKTSTVTLHLHKGFYHDRYQDIAEESSSPDLVIAPNAGIAVYTTWLPTLELIKKINVPAVFSDYCEEACHLASCCISSVTASPITIPIQLNPFRQPIVIEDSSLLLPCYSNCFLFGI